MLAGKFMGIGRLSCLESSQVMSESVHGAQFISSTAYCNGSCVEENKICKCNGKNVMIIKNEEYERDNHVKANSTFTHSVINMVGMLIGLGQLSTPYALENGGWTSAFLLVALGITCGYTAHLLGKCLKESPKSKNYQDIGEQAFGSKGRIVASAFIYLEIFFALVSYTISLSDNLITVLPGKHIIIPHIQLSTYAILAIIAVLIALPSLWLRDLSSISFLSSGGILMSLIIVSSVAWTAIFGGIEANKTIPVLQIRKIPSISGLYIFSYAGHIVFPNLYKAMRDPSKYTKVSIISFTLVTILYTGLAFTGAKLFGPTVSSQITLSMPRHLIATEIALWATVLTPMTKYALEFSPIAIQIEHNLPPSMSSRLRMIIRGSIGSVLLLVILASALTIPYFQYVLGLTGSLISVSISIIFPCAFYMKICWSRISNASLCLNATLIAIGFVLGIFGTISSSKSLIESVGKGHFP